jgi:hypothetical protein
MASRFRKATFMKVFIGAGKDNTPLLNGNEEDPGSVTLSIGINDGFSQPERNMNDIQPSLQEEGEVDDTESPTNHHDKDKASSDNESRTSTFTKRPHPHSPRGLMNRRSLSDRGINVESDNNAECVSPYYSPTRSRKNPKSRKNMAKGYSFRGGRSISPKPEKHIAEINVSSSNHPENVESSSAKAESNNKTIIPSKIESKGEKSKLRFLKGGSNKKRGGKDKADDDPVYVLTDLPLEVQRVPASDMQKSFAQLVVEGMFPITHSGPGEDVVNDMLETLSSSSSSSSSCYDDESESDGGDEDDLRKLEDYGGLSISDIMSSGKNVGSKKMDELPISDIIPSGKNLSGEIEKMATFPEEEDESEEQHDDVDDDDDDDDDDDGFSIMDIIQRKEPADVKMEKMVSLPEENENKDAISPQIRGDIAGFGGGNLDEAAAASSGRGENDEPLQPASLELPLARDRRRRSSVAFTASGGGANGGTIQPANLELTRERRRRRSSFSGTGGVKTKESDHRFQPYAANSSFAAVRSSGKMSSGKKDPLSLSEHLDSSAKLYRDEHGGKKDPLCLNGHLGASTKLCRDEHGGKKDLLGLSELLDVPAQAYTDEESAVAILESPKHPRDLQDEERNILGGDNNSKREGVEATDGEMEGGDGDAELTGPTTSKTSRRKSRMGLARVSKAAPVLQFSGNEPACPNSPLKSTIDDLRDNHIAGSGGVSNSLEKTPNSPRQGDDVLKAPSSREIPGFPALENAELKDSVTSEQQLEHQETYAKDATEKPSKEGVEKRKESKYRKSSQKKSKTGNLQHKKGSWDSPLKSEQSPSKTKRGVASESVTTWVRSPTTPVRKGKATVGSQAESRPLVTDSPARRARGTTPPSPTQDGGNDSPSRSPRRSATNTRQSRRRKSSLGVEALPLASRPEGARKSPRNRARKGISSDFTNVPQEEKHLPATDMPGSFDPKTESEDNEKSATLVGAETSRSTDILDSMSGNALDMPISSGKAADTCRQSDSVTGADRAQDKNEQGDEVGGRIFSREETTRPETKSVNGVIERVDNALPTMEYTPSDLLEGPGRDMRDVSLELQQVPFTSIFDVIAEQKKGCDICTDDDSGAGDFVPLRRKSSKGVNIFDVTNNQAEALDLFMAEDEANEAFDCMQFELEESKLRMREASFEVTRLERQVKSLKGRLDEIESGSKGSRLL